MGLWCVVQTHAGDRNKPEVTGITVDLVEYQVYKPQAATFYPVCSSAALGFTVLQMVGLRSPLIFIRYQGNVK